MNREDEALEHFTHKNRKVRVNCAQAILKTYHPTGLELESELVQEFKQYGHGKAPQKYCGAYFAASFLLETHKPDKMEDFDTWFTKEAGSRVCKEIRKGKKLNCNGCVLHAGRFLNDVFPVHNAS
ncbi:C-GCAxxG-C-C family (seleno)protein [Oceanispirochaeta crateris]|uniref:C-GCAxxG-C-C family (seleno)protein n=1 Tax=Oceanispirochaeta crateris TaxID=2518645 RepID=UPI00143DBDE5|nr:C-GCAxxG-C-C family (seleno)protein [Oceanispirochaeta crateris]